jgi:ribokinase
VQTPDHPAPTIVVVGSTNIDLITYAARAPEAGETLVADRFQMGFGGKGANQAVMASLLGAQVAMVNNLGDDSYGDMTMENFASFGIDTSHVQRVPGSSGVAPIWVEADGTNRILIVPGANATMTPQQAALAVADVPQPDVVIGQFEIPQAVTAAGFAAGRERGAITILNPAPAAPISAELLAVADWIIPNEIEFAMLFGVEPSDDSIRSIGADSGTRVVVTLGEAGVALLATSGEIVRLPAPQVTAVDTTGAGDAFVGGFAYGIASGWDPERAARLGVAVAGDSVTREGTQTSFPSGAECRRLIERL